MTTINAEPQGTQNLYKLSLCELCGSALYVVVHG
jgi:hypothetical protein